MPRRMAFKLVIDLAMTFLLLLALGYRITGNVFHEWIGILMFLFFVLHNAINWPWYRSLFKGRYGFRRFLNTTVNLLLLATMCLLMVSGVLISREIFSFQDIVDDMFVRQIHTLAAYWGLVLIAVHVGMHWNMILGAFRKMAGITRDNRFRTGILRIITMLIVCYGVWASFDRSMGGKLFLGYAFDYWDSRRPEFLFFTHNLAIMGLYVTATHYALKLLPGSTKSG